MKGGEENKFRSQLGKKDTQNPQWVNSHGLEWMVPSVIYTNHFPWVSGQYS